MVLKRYAFLQNLRMCVYNIKCNKLKEVLTTILFFISFFSFGQEKWNKHNTENYSISYPNSWELEAPGREERDFLIFAKLEEDDEFHENISLLVLEVDEEFELNSYVKLTEELIEKNVKELKIFNNIYEKEKQRHIMVWSGSVSNKHYMYKQYFFLNNKKLYVLRLITLSKTYDRYELIGSKILNSFQLN